MKTATINTGSGRLLEDFRGDFDQLASVMKASWDENVKPPFLYTAEFLADCFNYPGSSFSLAPAIYHGDELVAFAAGFPRRVRVGGELRNVIVSAFLTAASAYKSNGYGVVVWSELMKRAASAGFDGVVNYCVEGEAMNRMVEGCCRMLRLPVLRAAEFSYLSKLLFSKEPERPAETLSAGPERFVRAAAPVLNRADLARVWTEEEAAWQLNRVGAVSAQGGTAADPALLTGYVMTVSDRRLTKCLVIEDVLWGKLDPESRKALARELIARATAAGARLAILPRLGYADLEPFQAVGFRPSQRVLHAYLTLWNGAMPTQPPSTFYLDVF